MDWAAWVLAHEPVLRGGVFIGVFVAIATWERLSPRRALRLPRRQRWLANLGLVLLDTALLRLLFPLAALGWAAFCAARGWGLLNHWRLPFWAAAPLAVVALDFVIWLQHRMFHTVPLLWRVHRVHHADPDIDVSTGLRFHPLEIGLSMLIKLAAVAALGAPVLAVLVFELLLNATAMFNHGNLRLPSAVDRVLRWIVVTPDMHRVHHSIVDDEHNSNFGFNLPWWDRLFGSYRAQPRAGHTAMTIGLRGHTDAREVTRLSRLLWLPFKGAASEGSSPHNTKS